MVKKSTKEVKPTAKKKPPNAGKGRRKGSVNKTTAMLKDAILQAAEAAGNEIKTKTGKKKKEGLVGYLKQQAIDNPKAFLPLLGKVIPLQISGPDGGPIETSNSFVFVPVGADHEPNKN